MNLILCSRLILRLRPSASILMSFFIIMTGLRVKAQTHSPVLTVREDMPVIDITVKQVIYGNGVFLACLIYPTRLYKSVDGVSWSKIAGPNLGSDTNISDYKQHPSLAYGAGRFVLASDSGRIFSSPDLLTWTRSTSGTRQNIIAVKYLDSIFYAVGDSATFLSSPDGVNWTAQHTGTGDTTGSYQEIIYGNGRLIITAYNHMFDSSAIEVFYDRTGGTAGPWTTDSTRASYRLTRRKHPDPLRRSRPRNAAANFQ